MSGYSPSFFEVPGDGPAKKKKDPGFTEEEFKDGFSSTPMYGEFGEPSNARSVMRRNWRKDEEDAN